MQEEIANVSAGIPGTGQTPAGKPPGFGDPIVSPGAAKNWKKQNAMFRRKAPKMVAEVKEKKTLNTKDVPLYDSNGKVVGHVHKSTSSVGAAKILKTPTAERTARYGKSGWVGKNLREDTFAGAVVFEVNSKLFHNLTLAKRKGKHWRTYLEEDDCYAEIREWARKNKGPIVVRNENTGEMRYVRYGR